MLNSALGLLFANYCSLPPACCFWSLNIPISILNTTITINPQHAQYKTFGFLFYCLLLLLQAPPTKTHKLETVPKPWSFLPHSFSERPKAEHPRRQRQLRLHLTAIWENGPGILFGCFSNALYQLRVAGNREDYDFSRMGTPYAFCVIRLSHRHQITRKRKLDILSFASRKATQLVHNIHIHNNNIPQSLLESYSPLFVIMHIYH